MINQSLANVTQTGGNTQTVQNMADGIGFTTGQGYCLIIGFTLIAITLILVIGKIVQTAILKINVLTKKQIEYIIDTIKKDIDT